MIVVLLVFIYFTERFPLSNEFVRDNVAVLDLARLYTSVFMMSL